MKMKLEKWHPRLTSLDDNDLIDNYFYLTNYPCSKWHQKTNTRHQNNYSIDKKDDFASSIKSVKKILSPTEADNNFIFETYQDMNVIHFGSNQKSKRFNQLAKSLGIFVYAFKHRSEFNNLLIYNVELPYFWIAIFFKVFLKKKITLQLEDNYLIVEKNLFKKNLYSLSYHFVDTVITSNEMNQDCFKGKKVHIYNGFKTFTENRNKYLDKNVFIFGGNINKIRGSNAIKDLVDYLEKNYDDFELNLTGKITLDKKTLENKRVKYHGFLHHDEYQKLLQYCNYGLILQQNDHLGRGFFPSKAIDYHKSGLIILNLAYENK